LAQGKKGSQLKIVKESGLGLLRDTGSKEVSASFSALPPELRDPAHERAKQLLVLTKSNSRSPVHRPGYLDVVAVRRFDATAKVPNSTCCWQNRRWRASTSSCASRPALSCTTTRQTSRRRSSPPPAAGLTNCVTTCWFMPAKNAATPCCAAIRMPSRPAMWP